MPNATSETALELGRGAFDRGDLPEACAQFQRAIAQGCDTAEPHHFLGFIARGRNAIDEAGEHYAAALERAPGDAQLHNNLAEIRHSQGRLAEALTLYRRAASLAPHSAEIQANTGGLLMALHRPDEALYHVECALALNSGLLSARADAATALCALGRYQDAIGHYRDVWRAQPNNASARYLEALAVLALGDFELGWRLHECRWYAQLGHDRRRALPQPYWLGEDDIAGRTILLHAEQGLGDTLQFIRYARLVNARGARVLIEVQPALQPLIAGMHGVAGVYARGDTLPPFDMQSSLMSMPRAFLTRLSTVPAQMPYLAAPEERLAHWRARLGPRDGRRRVAIAWSGTANPWNRAVPVQLLARLLSRPDCEFHVAQTEIWDTDRAALASLPGLVDHSAALRDFADTAALLDGMDLVISIDTALAHLAGATGRPAWVMLPIGPDYRWLTDRCDSPWYPTMRLFRQARLHDWPDVVERICAALDAMPANLLLE